MKIYLELLEKVLKEGNIREDRTKTGTLSIFGHSIRINLQEGFPLLTTKKLHIPSIVYELLWFIKGSTNVDFLQKNNISIWDEWADSEGNLGPIYGHQWRRWTVNENKHIDQLSEVIEEIQKNPYSRRHIVSAWNVGDLDKMALPPCHILFQFYVKNENLSCLMFQRSADIFLGLPFNIASYALLLSMVAQVTNLKPFELVVVLGDAHLYSNHIEQAKLQLSREVRSLPVLKLNSEITSIFDFQFKDISFENYFSHPSIKADISV